MARNNSYYEDEIREGFFIPEMTKRYGQYRWMFLVKFDEYATNMVSSGLLTMVLSLELQDTMDLYHGTMRT